MVAVRGHYNGKVVVLDESVAIQPEAEVLVLFRDDKDLNPERARSIRKRLRGSGKGLHLVEKLLTERRKDG